MELDLAWATKAGKDPVALFKEHPGRFPLWHVNDSSSEMQTITDVGNGVVEFKRIFEAAKINIPSNLPRHSSSIKDIDPVLKTLKCWLRKISGIRTS
jgi:formiminotetrahydrofolate cyclodeaminase